MLTLINAWCQTLGLSNDTWRGCCSRRFTCRSSNKRNCKGGSQLSAKKAKIRKHSKVSSSSFVWTNRATPSTTHKKTEKVLPTRPLSSRLARLGRLIYSILIMDYYICFISFTPKRKRTWAGSQPTTSQQPSVRDVEVTVTASTSASRKQIDHGFWDCCWM